MLFQFHFFFLLLSLKKIKAWGLSRYVSIGWLYLWCFKNRLLMITNAYIFFSPVFHRIGSDLLVGGVTPGSTKQRQCNLGWGPSMMSWRWAPGNDADSKLHMGVEPKIGGKPPKWMVKIRENPIRIDDLGVPLFLETPIWGWCLHHLSNLLYYFITSVNDQWVLHVENLYILSLMKVTISWEYAEPPSGCLHQSYL